MQLAEILSVTWVYLLQLKAEPPTRIADLVLSQELGCILD